MQANGITFGSHTVNHVLLTRTAPARAQQEIEYSRKQMCEELGQEIACFSYPWGSTSGHIRQLVASAGYRYACVTEKTYSKRPEDPFLISRIPVSGPLLSGTNDSFDRDATCVSLGISVLQARRAQKHPVLQAYPGRPMRIAYVIDSIDGWDAGGTETQIRCLLAALDRDYFQPKLFFLSPSLSLSNEQFPCPVFVANSDFPFRRSSMIASLARGLREFRPHVVQTFFRDGTLFGTCAAKFARVPVLVQSVRNLGYWMTPIDRFLQPRVRSMSTLLQCNSRTIYDWLQHASIGKSQSIDILPNFLDLQRFSPPSQVERSALRKQFDISEKQPVIVSVANMTAVKDLSTLLEAAKLVHATLPEAYFVLVGDGPLREALTEQIQQLGLETVVRLVGSQLDVRPWLAAADLAVLTSTSEGSSNSVLEYMGMGLPSILSNIPANRELADDVFYTVGDASELAGKIISLWKSPGERQRLSMEYRIRAIQYGGDAFQERAQGFYVRMIAGAT